MCWTPLYVNKNKSHGTQNVKTLAQDNTICVGHNMCWKNKSHGTQNVQTLNRTTQYVLDTSICKQKQITRNSERKDT